MAYNVIPYVKPTMMFHIRSVRVAFDPDRIWRFLNQKQMLNRRQKPVDDRGGGDGGEGGVKEGQ